MQEHRSRWRDASCVDRLIVGAVVGSVDRVSQGEPGRPGQPDRARHSEQRRSGQPDRANQSDPGRPGQPDRGSQGEPGCPGQPDRASQGEPGRPGQPGRASQGGQAALAPYLSKLGKLGKPFTVTSLLILEFYVYDITVLGYSNIMMLCYHIAIVLAQPNINLLM